MAAIYNPLAALMSSDSVAPVTSPLYHALDAVQVSDWPKKNAAYSAAEKQIRYAAASAFLFIALLNCKENGFLHCRLHSDQLSQKQPENIVLFAVVMGYTT